MIVFVPIHWITGKPTMPYLQRRVSSQQLPKAPGESVSLGDHLPSLWWDLCPALFRFCASNHTCWKSVSTIARPCPEGSMRPPPNLIVFLLSYLWCSLSLGSWGWEGLWYVPLKAEHSVSSQHFDYLKVLALTAAHYRRKFIWPRWKETPDYR